MVIKKHYESVRPVMKSCCAICVTFNPDLEVLNRVVQSALTEVEKVYVVDNGTGIFFSFLNWGDKNIECLALKENKGIAAGFNAGITLARNAGFSHVLLLDQDSVVPHGMIRRYHEVSSEKSAQKLLAAVGPRYRNPYTGHISEFLRFKWFRNTRPRVKEQESTVETDFLISSGSFYNIRVFEQVGLFNEDLFIDHVDTEWCLRARSLGFRLLGFRDVVMEHSLGETAVRLWLLRWRTQPIHKPFRLYYVVRNSLLMYRMSHTPKKWISGDLLRLLRLVLVYAIFSSQRYEAFKWILLGIRDGIRGASGPAPSI